MTHDDLYMTLLASTAAPGLARTLVEQRLMKWGLDHRADDVFLITTELVTNACAATPRQSIGLRFRRDGAGLFLEVWDASDAVPTMKPLAELGLDDLDVSEDGFDVNGGWGLQIVQALAADCGYRFLRTGGKIVWARVAVNSVGDAYG